MFLRSVFTLIPNQTLDSRAPLAAGTKIRTPARAGGGTKKRRTADMQHVLAACRACSLSIRVSFGRHTYSTRGFCKDLSMCRYTCVCVRTCITTCMLFEDQCVCVCMYIHADAQSLHLSAKFTQIRAKIWSVGFRHHHRHAEVILAIVYSTMGFRHQGLACWV